MMITREITVNELLEEAKKALHDVESGEKFICRDLFRGIEWNRVPIGVRRSFGNLFYAYAQGDGSALLNIIGKTKSGQQEYIKK